ncbi:Rieske [2Fe-2S] iron-sulfur domain-containing protein [Gaertneriomyces semiglobifer]|nr:Rieske [2Fe-2S] iron-sulfur domain-containing protein [Gaertneriomyces semiglobifer]
MAAPNWHPLAPLSTFLTTNRTTLDPSNPLPYSCKQLSLPALPSRPDKERSIAVFYRPDERKLYAVSSVCPHQGGNLSRGPMMDIEDMGVKWGCAVVCPLHGWVFDLTTGQCDRSSYMLDVYDVRIGEVLTEDDAPDATKATSKPGGIVPENYDGDPMVYVSFEPRNRGK